MAELKYLLFDVFAVVCARNYLRDTGLIHT